jgi:hypothetical protein
MVGYTFMLLTGLDGRQVPDSLSDRDHDAVREGQHPEDFKSTFLSLSEGNKRSTTFVQGKRNMDSSGVLGYCGRQCTN